MQEKRVKNEGKKCRKKLTRKRAKNVEKIKGKGQFFLEKTINVKKGKKCRKKSSEKGQKTSQKKDQKWTKNRREND